MTEVALLNRFLIRFDSIAQGTEAVAPALKRALPELLNCSSFSDQAIQ